MSNPGLPPGFTLDQQPSGLPDGFTLDDQSAPQGQDRGGFSVLQSAARAGTFGLSDVAAAGLGAAASHLTSHPQSYAEARAKIQADADASAAAHPLADAAGNVIGAVASSPLLAAAMPFKAALALRAGSKAANAARLVGQGVLQGGEYGAATGAVKGAQDDGAVGAAEGAASGAGTGAVAGAAGSLVAGGAAAAAPVIKKAVFSDAGQKSIALLAKTFGVSPAGMARVYTQFRADAGRAPAMGELTDLYNRGEIARMVSKSPQLAAPVAQAAQDSATALPGRLSEAVTDTVGKTPVLKSPQGPNVVGNGEDAADLVAARDKNIKDALKPIRQDQIMLAPEEVEFLRGELLPHAGLTRLGRKAIHEDLDQGHLTVGNADTLRQSLKARAAANPGEGFAEMAGGLEQIAKDASPEYGKALDQYARDSNYIDAHAHGLTGKTPGQTQDPLLIRSLATPEGREGYQSGIATRLGNQAFDSEQGATSLAKDLSEQSATSGHLANTFSPITVDTLRTRAAAELKGTNSLKAIASGSTPASKGADLGQAALSVVSHSWPMKVYHGIKAHLGAGMSDNVARITARYLTDPDMAAQGINLMRRHGVDAATTRRIVQKAAAAGAAGGAAASN